MSGEWIAPPRDFFTRHKIQSIRNRRCFLMDGLVEQVLPPSAPDQKVMKSDAKREAAVFKKKARDILLQSARGKHLHLLEEVPRTPSMREPWEVILAVKQSKKVKSPGQDNITIDLMEAAVIYKPNNPLTKRKPTKRTGWVQKIILLNRPPSCHQSTYRKCAEYKIPIAIALVDYNKAFDSVEIQDVIEALQEQGVDTVYIEVLKHIYHHAKSFIRLHKDSRPFKLERGVRQDTSAPKLFTACLEKVFRKLNWDQKGIRIDGEYLNHLRFADDIIILAKNGLELNQMLHESMWKV
ncbi:uncharacterized protein LOC122264821 [Penaeus japonicus]|uniref:uncharacterized protein LOC122264821 n=1 Tax=Penaeus japonicus TaxID=27405 RepID=UPI001C70F3D2|nr:uncharacterized protein LOC122264821 [Penaeus japonicus]